MADVQYNEQETVGHCFTTVVNIEPIQELAKSGKEPSYSDQGLTYEPNQNNMIVTKVSEYFTCIWRKTLWIMICAR